MRYFDTSFLVPLLIPEPKTTPVEKFFESLSEDETLVFSSWGQLEFASVAARLFRMGEMSASDAQACIEQFNRVLTQSFRLHAPSSEDFRKARAFIAKFQTKLRTGDALHLAMADNLEVMTTHTLDSGMLEAGKQLGLSVEGCP
ncbi:MAG: type II toxin-antitoxin system VapC family toxin [Spiribacter salinus]|uniref:Type II toxin-antitoxin system VapC family toxin n=1 Tax=Spiribacter salinus TaxID=1335746 RepID=A0A540V7S8_9GAMM|nr:MAG: type II toxin-antitoxin system VapC family toxin [Spiribacter salinus]